MPVTPPSTDLPLFEVMYQCRAMRRLKPDPVPDEVLLQLVDCALRAPSGSNAQNWRFVVVTDGAQKRRLQAVWQRTWAFYLDAAASAELRGHEDAAGRERMVRAATWLVDHLDEVPAIVCVALAPDEAFERALKAPATLWKAVRHLGLGATLRLFARAPSINAMAAGSSAYPAVQNLLLAARALGLGAVITTQHFFVPGEFEAVLGLPRGTRLAALVPIGYPRGRFGPVTRPPVEDVVSWQRCGAPRAAR
ncbi:MAG: nitroreductase family protein [Gammaproteobacteria bacterium]|nr:nitroreductase family protein [Gammaproteobacteria bacterium]MCP5199558.1 nitroreductase family protein [Gammaproteobacteria bacterium]